MSHVSKTIDGHTVTVTGPAPLELAARIEAALKPGEAHHWIVPEFGFLFSTEDAAQRYLENIDSQSKPTAYYTAAPPAQTPPPREPLTKDQVKQLLQDSAYDDASMQCKADFINGIRHAEVAHGITKHQPTAAPAASTT